jgi:hypothetical protein
MTENHLAVKQYDNYTQQFVSHTSMLDLKYFFLIMIFAQIYMNTLSLRVGIYIMITIKLLNLKYLGCIFFSITILVLKLNFLVFFQKNTIY